MDRKNCHEPEAQVCREIRARKAPGERGENSMTEEERKTFSDSLKRLVDEAKRTGDWSAIWGNPDTDTDPLQD